VGEQVSTALGRRGHAVSADNPELAATLSEHIIALIEDSGVVQVCHRRWEEQRSATIARLTADSRLTDLVDTDRLIAGHDTLLAMYLIYDGDV